MSRGGGPALMRVGRSVRVDGELWVVLGQTPVSGSWWVGRWIGGTWQEQSVKARDCSPVTALAGFTGATR